MGLFIVCTLTSFYILFTQIPFAKRCQHYLPSPENTVFLPYVARFGTTGAPCVKASIDGRLFNQVPVDTGSTGMAVGAPNLPHVNTTSKPAAWQYFSSSNILYNGHLVDLDVTFHGADGSSATTTVPVLLVNKSVRCKWYDPTKDNGNCGPNPKNSSQLPEPRDTKKIIYMGVGFGRNKKGQGQPNALPKANPFLNIHTLNGEALPKGSLRTGYVVSTAGVWLGLTSANTDGFSFTKLQPGVTHAEDPRDWAMVDMCAQVNDSPYSCGQALIDTGIKQMYWRTSPGIITPNRTIPAPSGDGTTKRVLAGTKLSVSIPNTTNPIAEYWFTVGEGDAVEPLHVYPQRAADPAYVNTGRNFLYGFSVAFDAVSGRFGFKRVISTQQASPPQRPSDTA